MPGDPIDVAFTAADFRRVCMLIHVHAGIALGPAKRNLAYSRLSPLVRGAGHATFGTWLDALEQGGDASALEQFVNALTTNLTAFFREAHHFPRLACHLSEVARRRSVTLWCAAAATGEEAYSMAIAACEAFASLRPPVRIIATDIDTAALAVARRGVYSLDRVAALDATRLRRFFERGTGANGGLARVRGAVRALVEFRQVNLPGERWGVPGELAAIFCRNVLIYFDRATQARIVARLAPLLDRRGLLFTGHAESLVHVPQLRLQAHGVYARA
jgi:chemotaxis protein methyltransferase CheR